MKQSLIYVIVVTYNGMKWLDRCFGSIYASSIPLRVIAVDNGSADGTVDALRAKYPAVEIVETGQNLGFGKANNIGMGLALDAGCDYVYLLNQDAWVDPDTVERMVGIQQSNPEYFVLSPIQLTGDRSGMDRGFETICGEWNCPGYLKDVSAGQVAELYRIGFVMAAHWLVSRQSLDTIGGFAPVFSHYGEDDNYLHRVGYHGYRAGICPGVFGVHDRHDRVEGADQTIRRDLYVWFLMKVCNINKPAPKIWFSAYWRLLRDSFRMAGQYRSLLPFRLLGKGVGNGREIARTRKQTVKTGPNYL